MTLDKASKSAGRVLLPTYVTPTKYDLKITPDMVNYTFQGVVSICMTCSAPATEADAKRITLHANELLFETASFVAVATDSSSAPVTAEQVRTTNTWNVLETTPVLQ